jgi:hypothetical protein
MALLVALLAACAPTAPRAADGAAPATVVRILAPFGSTQRLSPTLRVSERVGGRCWTTSEADPARPDAWRCMAGNRISDPCFAGSENTRPVMACMTAPWTDTVVLLEPSEPLSPRPGPVDDQLILGDPWAIELAGGVRCTRLTGATSGVAGMRVSYGCEGGGVIVVGEVDRSAPEWRVFVMRGDQPVLDVAGVSVAWY